MARNPAPVFGRRIRAARCTQSTKPTTAPFAIGGLWRPHITVAASAQCGPFPE